MDYRLLKLTDFNKGFTKLLEQLTTVGDIPPKDFIKRFYEITKNTNHKIYVLEKANKIVSCATLFIEPKFIHKCGFVGHIEDVVVDQACRGQNLGRKIIDFLTMEAEKQGCYKILLDCADSNVKFYEKCNYLRKGAYMAKYLNPIQKEVDLTSKLIGFCKDYHLEIITGTILLGYGSYYLYKKYKKNKKNFDKNLKLII